MSVISEEFGNSLRSFAQDYYKEVVQETPNQNIVIAPIVLQIVLTLAMLGALGETASQLKRSLRFDNLTHSNIVTEVAILAKNLKNTGGVKRANKLYVDNQFPVLKSFKKDIKRVENINFSNDFKARAVMNKWVEKQTNNTIKDLFSEPLDPETKLIIISTIYFKADWIHAFEYEFNNTFWMNNENSKSIEFMKIKKAKLFNYAILPKLDASAIELKYKDTNISMLLILPNDKDGLSKTELKLEKVDIADIMTEMQEEMLEVTIPKFTIETTVQLNNILQRLGLQRMFSDEADFGGISKEPLKVSKVVQKSFLNVDLKGTEAGSATFMGFQSRMGSSNKIFNANRGFVFYLKNSDNNILFMGRFCGQK